MRTWILALLAVALAGVALTLAEKPEPGPGAVLLMGGAVLAELLAGRAAYPGAFSVAGAFYLAAVLAPGLGPAAAVVAVLAGVGLRTLVPERFHVPAEAAEPRRTSPPRYRLALVDALPPLLAAAAVTLLGDSPVASAVALAAFLLAALTVPRLLEAGLERPAALTVAVAFAGGALGRLMAGNPWWALWLFPVLAVLQWLSLAKLPRPGRPAPPGPAASAARAAGRAPAPGR